MRLTPSHRSRSPTPMGHNLTISQVWVRGSEVQLSGPGLPFGLASARAQLSVTAPLNLER
jgi:hypothetical protein